jgi:hypothetical protein
LVVANTLNLGHVANEDLAINIRRKSGMRNNNPRGSQQHELLRPAVPAQPH